MSVEALKAAAYDLLGQNEQIMSALRAINQELSTRTNEKEVKKEVKK